MGKKPKTGLDVLGREQINRMREAGDKKRRVSGDLIDLSQAAQPGGKGVFTKVQRATFNGHCDIAIASLAQREFEDWYDAILAIIQIMKQAGFEETTVTFTVKQIEHVAVSVDGNKNLYAEAMNYLRKRATTVISIPGQAPGLINKEAAIHDPIRQAVIENTTGKGTEREPTD